MKHIPSAKLMFLAVCLIPAVAAAQPCPMAKGGAEGNPGLRMGRGPGAGAGAGLQRGGLGLRGNWWAAPRVQETLGLTPEQIDLLSDQNTKLRKEQIQLRADIEKARIELEEILRADPVDEKKATAVAQDLGRLAAAQVELMASQRILVAKTLTSEQKAKAKDLMAKISRQQLKKAEMAGPEMRQRMMQQKKAAQDRERMRKRLLWEEKGMSAPEAQMKTKAGETE